MELAGEPVVELTGGSTGGQVMESSGEQVVELAGELKVELAGEPSVELVVEEKEIPTPPTLPTPSVMVSKAGDISDEWLLWK